MKVKVLATGAYAPETCLTNADLEKLVETNDAWITERTGIKSRHVAPDNVPTSALASRAAKIALERAGVTPEEVDTLIVATSTPDRLVPPCSAVVQKEVGCFDAACSDLVAACSGFTYALHHARGLVASGLSKRCLIVGAEELSRITNYKDRQTCILFGDGAGAAVLGPSDGDSDILYSRMGCDGRLDHLITTPCFGTAEKPTAESLERGDWGIQMKGREVFKFAVPKFVEIMKTALAETKLTLADIKWVIPHQMNARMIEAVAERLELPLDRIVINIDRYGNTSAASIPIALDEAIRDGKVKRGDLLLFSAMGAGITWGTVILKW
jgi:3-oxoacyl-[acyl-carrier-protein] synthase III